MVWIGRGCIGDIRSCPQHAYQVYRIGLIGCAGLDPDVTWTKLGYDCYAGL